MMQPEDGLDPHLLKWFEGLRPTPPRDHKRAAQGRESFLQEARSLGRPVSRAADRRGSGWVGLFQPLTSRESWSMTRVAVLLLSIVLFLGGGVGVTAYAAQSALPGDVLYGVKTGWEDAQLALSSTAAGDFELHLQFARARLNEIMTLVAQGRHEDAEAAVDALAYQLRQAREALRVVAEEDPLLAVELAGRYVDFVTESRQAIAALVLSAPKHAQGVLDDALGVLEAALGALGKNLPDDADKQGGGADKSDLQRGNKPDDDGDELDDDDIEEPDDDAAEPDDDGVDEPDDGDADESDDDDEADDDDDDGVDEPDDDDVDEPDDADEADDRDDDRDDDDDGDEEDD
jgi:hypothetical protein